MRVRGLAQLGAPFGESAAQRVAGDRGWIEAAAFFDKKLKLAGSLLFGRFERPTD
jgi:hypothetical protein